MDNLVKRYENSFKQNSNLPALTDYTSGKEYCYAELASKVDYCHKLFREVGINKGDKIALIGKNSIDWICTYIGVITYGATIVPILADFNPKDMAGIINHSDARILFCDRSILEKIEVESLEHIEKTMTLEDIPAPQMEGFDVNAIKYADLDDEDVVVISYTSGTTGTSKGVMIPMRSLTHNVQFALDHNFHFKESRVLALLPLAHAYGCAFDMLTPLTVGSHVWVLGRIPTPSIMLQALKDVKPHLICSVPMVMEKIVRKSLLPKLGETPIKILTHLPLIRKFIFRKMRDGLMNAFGGNISEVNMGGAALAPDVEKILRHINFPFTVGYGMTECGPLISYDTWRDFKPGSCGTILPGMEVRVMSEGYEKNLGEICVRGINVMKGYYKNPEATDAVMIDGWFHTGDVGYVDKHGTIFLKGRCKSMILTSSGQNIYPEEIESKLNHLPLVSESLVYEEGGKLYALVLPDKEKSQAMTDDEIDTVMVENLTTLNTLVAPYEKVSDIRVCLAPFEKTPKQSIKRFLYPKIAKFRMITRGK